MKRYRIIALLVVLLLLCSTLVTALPGPASEDGSWSGGCTDILVGKDATVDGSVIGTYSCDGAVYAELKVVPEATYRNGTMLPIYYRPYPNNYNAYVNALEEEELLGEIPQAAETYRYIVNSVYYDDQNCGGVNEYGVGIGETTIGGKKDLRVPTKVGWMWAYSNYPSTSLMTLGLQRAKTAREAVKIMGELAETYGYVQSGEHMTVSDKNEVWAMEIFGGGKDWTPDSGKPGAVWAAKRVPDGEMAISANSSRLGLIEEISEDGEDFLTSANVFTLAEEMEWWTPGEDFIWYKVYGNRGDAHSEREWSIVNKFAPSLGVEVEDPIFFSFKPDEKVSVQDIMGMYRDYFTDIEGMDITLDEAYKLANGNTSPLASPFGPSALHSLLGLKTKRSVATRSSVFTYVMQHKDWLPDPVGTVMWYTPGPALSGSYTPIYAGTTELPEEWSYTPMTGIDRDSAWWAFTMVDGLSLIEWQNAIKDIAAVRDPMEATLLAEQAEVEAKAAELYENERGNSAVKIKGKKAAEKREEHGKRAAEQYLTKYTKANLNAVADTYWDLVDYLLFKYYFRVGKSVPTPAPEYRAAAGL